MPFDDDYKDLSEGLNKGLKNVSPKKSSVQEASSLKKESRSSFENKVDEQQTAEVLKREKAIKLAIKWQELIVNKTLPPNQTVYFKEVEKEILSKLVILGQELNIDETEHEGAGSLFLISLLLKTMIEYRNKINTLEYELDKLKNNSKPQT